MANNSLSTSDIVLPVDVAQGIYDQAFSESVIARLSGQRPMLFGDSTVMTFTGLPKAQLVSEGGAKKGTKPAFGSITVKPAKFQITVRMNNEVQWADLDHNEGVIREITSKFGTALGRALDTYVIHKADPFTGEVDPSVTTGLCDAESVIEYKDIEPDFAVEKACRAVKKNHYPVNGIALDEDFGFDLATMRDENGRKIYGDLGLGDGITSFLGKTTACGDTLVGANELEEESDILAIVGDFRDAIRWGVQKEIKAKIIEYGDPDGEGDLQNLNQVALRAEIVYGVGITTPDAFALVKKAE